MHELHDSEGLKSNDNEDWSQVPAGGRTATILRERLPQSDLMWIFLTNRQTALSCTYANS